MKYTIVFPRVGDSGAPYAYALLGCVPVHTTSGRVQTGMRIVELDESHECIQDAIGGKELVLIGMATERFNTVPDPAAVPDGVRVHYGFDGDSCMPQVVMDIDDHEGALVVYDKTVSELVARVARILRALRALPEEGTHD